MASSDDVFPPDNQCEICGVRLADEIVIQEFADGSLARLCAECAAGAALEADCQAGYGRQQSGSKVEPLSDADPMEMTKELLTPVVDLIGLQREMQGALERLAASLETFAAGVLTENLDKTATVEDRVQALERELEATRARLLEAEALLAAAAITPAVAGVGVEAANATAAATEAAAAAAAGTATGAAGTDPPIEAPVSPAPSPEASAETPPTLAADGAGPTPVAAAAVAAPPIEAAARAAGAGVAAAATEEQEPQHGFRIEEVQAVQRYFNDSPFTGKTRDVGHSLGKKPQVNLTRAAGPEPRAFVTVAWNIVWYQYLVDLRLDVPTDRRVVLHREGLDLDELTHYFKEKNATVNDDGRVDASELEVKLLSDPSALITEMTPGEEKALEDATEEVWDQHIAPEFKWDD